MRPMKTRGEGWLRKAWGPAPGASEGSRNPMRRMTGYSGTPFGPAMTWKFVMLLAPARCDRRGLRPPTANSLRLWLIRRYRPARRRREGLLSARGQPLFGGRRHRLAPAEGHALEQAVLPHEL